MNLSFYKKLLKKTGFIGASEGNSMVPIIYPNDGLFIKPALLNNIKVNDIITFYQKNNLITHRVVYKKSNYYITKGDNSYYSDIKIKKNQIIGKVDKIKRQKTFFRPEDLYLIQSSLYMKEIIKLKSVFDKEKVSFVFLKGLPLHLYFEKNHPKRLYFDCDILIAKKDVNKAEAILYKFGYKNTSEKSNYIENNFYKEINGFIVIFDLHLEPAFLMTQASRLEALYPHKLIDKLTEELLINKNLITINEEKFFILNKNYLILYLALHIFHHNFHGVFQYQFLDLIIRKIRLKNNDWRFIYQKAHKYQVFSFVSPVFLLLKKYYQTPVPDLLLSDSKKYNNINIFDDEPRIRAGVNRFRLIFSLSTQPLWKKLTVFFNIELIVLFWNIISRKLFYYFSNQKQTDKSLF